MRKKILLTGGTGFIGSHVLRLLSRKYTILAPKRTELNIVDQNSVNQYLKNKKFDAVIHCAILTPHLKECDQEANLLDYTMRGLLNLQYHEDKFDKIIYVGSGAEFDKTRDIISVQEEQIGQMIPQDAYGYAKYILNKLARTSQKIYNLRVFGCYGPGEQPRRFIRSAITDCLAGKPITIRQDCLFSYIFINDLVYIMDWFLIHTPRYHDYNICDGKIYKLSQLANMVSRCMKTHTQGITIQQTGFNKQYTANNTRLLQELSSFTFTPMEQGIEQEITWLKDFLYAKTGS